MVKNYRKGGSKEICQLPKSEFIRRFSMHILPKNFVRIRHYGILSSTGKKKHLITIRRQTGEVRLPVNRGPIMAGLCPVCKKGKLVTIAIFQDRGPPVDLIRQLNQQKKQRHRV